MIGTCPSVAMTFINPSATLSTTSSTSLSVALGSLSISYIVFEVEGVDDDGASCMRFVDVAVVVGGGGGRREKRVGSRTTKSRYWSNTCSTNSTELDRATASANSSSNGRGRMLVKLT